LVLQKYWTRSKQSGPDQQLFDPRKQCGLNPSFVVWLWGGFI